jgi:2-iminobutanoate/2-iminopropanoate deaminase
MSRPKIADSRRNKDSDEIAASEITVEDKPMQATSRQKVSTNEAPSAIGPYSQAIVAGGFVHCSGQIALDPKDGQLIAGDATAQTERALENLKAVLKAAGSDMSKVVKVNVFLVSMEDFAAMNKVYGRFFLGNEAPARSTIGVNQLPRNALVEIDCTALAG